MTTNPFRIVRIHDSFGGRADGDGDVELLITAMNMLATVTKNRTRSKIMVDTWEIQYVRSLNPGKLRGETINMVLLLIK